MTLTDREIRQIVAQAVLAPSIHNTQPWRFVAHRGGADEVRLEVYADRSRSVAVVDPTGRQLTISCGVAVEFAVLSARAAGQDVALDAFAEPTEPDLLARLTLTPGRPASADERALVDAIPLRHTDRDPFDPRPLPKALLDELRRGVQGCGAWLRGIERPDDVVRAVALLAHADHVERADPAYRTELRAWARFGADAADGIPREALPKVDPARRASNWLLRDFALADPRADHAHPAAAADQPRAGAGAPAEPPPVENPYVAVLGTESDSPRAWLATGRALGWLLLRATTHAVVASPLTQVLDLPASRVLLARELGLVGHPQLVLRLGFGHARPTTGRRPVDEVLTLIG